MSALLRGRRPATMADLEALPSHVRGEIIDGVLYTSPRPRSRHMNVEGAVFAKLRGPFQGGTGGPGGWWILNEPGIEVPGSPEFSPDIAGWRRERMPVLPLDQVDVVPDWVCEVLSPSTRGYDIRIKRPFYARIGVRYLWYIDIEARSLVVSRLENGHWLEIGVHGEDDLIRAEPFDAIEIALAEWWQTGEPPPPPPEPAT